MAFFAKADAKVRTIFELPKLFRSFFSKSFFLKVAGSNPLTLFSISTHLRFSLESGCKSTALRHILQIFTTLFSYFFAFVYLSHWFSKDAVQHILNTFGADTGVARTLYIVYKFKKLEFHPSQPSPFTVLCEVWRVWRVKIQLFIFQPTKQLPQKNTVFLKKITVF